MTLSVKYIIVNEMYPLLGIRFPSDLDVVMAVSGEDASVPVLIKCEIILVKGLVCDEKFVHWLYKVFGDKGIDILSTFKRKYVFGRWKSDLLSCSILA